MTNSPRRFSVVENLCATGKDTDARKEDRLVVTDDFAAVIDGATSSGPIGGRPGGIVAAEAVEQTIRDLAPDASVRDFVDGATTAIARAIGDWPDETTMRPSAVAAVWSRARGEALSLTTPSPSAKGSPSWNIAFSATTLSTILP